MKKLYKIDIVCVCGHKRSDHLVSKVQMDCCYECNQPLVEWHETHKQWKKDNMMDIEPQPPDNITLCFNFRPDNLRTLELASEKVV